MYFSQFNEKVLRGEVVRLQQTNATALQEAERRLSEVLATSQRAEQRLRKELSDVREAGKTAHETLQVSD